MQAVGEMAVSKYQTLAAGRRVQMPRRKRYKDRDRQIAAAISAYDDGHLTLTEFLRQTAHHFDPVDENLGDIMGELNGLQNEEVNFKVIF